MKVRSWLNVLPSSRMWSCLKAGENTHGGLGLEAAVRHATCRPGVRRRKKKSRLKYERYIGKVGYRPSWHFDS